jgi:hypothetical protein
VAADPVDREHRLRGALEDLDGERATRDGNCVDRHDDTHSFVVVRDW